jgi:tRNA pseudouridine55 synthase
MDKVLLIDKPIGWTSFDVVAKIRSQLKSADVDKPKVGHAGTLDPLASGLLIVLVGRECKNQDKYMKLDKTYQVRVKLGQTSTTDDAEGEITSISDKKPTLEELKSAINSFIGEASQIPPIYSAIKINGKRAYKMAREGKVPEMKPRTVTIHAISDIVYKYPNVEFATEVSSGTYIRSLVRDIGQKLGTGAYMTGLSRVSIGQYKLSSAHKIGSDGIAII